MTSPLDAFPSGEKDQIQAAIRDAAGRFDRGRLNAVSIVLVNGDCTERFLALEGADAAECEQMREALILSLVALGVSREEIAQARSVSDIGLSATRDACHRIEGA